MSDVGRCDVRIPGVPAMIRGVFKASKPNEHAQAAWWREKFAHSTLGREGVTAAVPYLGTAVIPEYLGADGGGGLSAGASVLVMAEAVMPLQTLWDEVNGGKSIGKYCIPNPIAPYAFHDESPHLRSIQSIVSDLLGILMQLSRHRLVHGDLKPNNLLVFHRTPTANAVPKANARGYRTEWSMHRSVGAWEDIEVKVCDFGLMLEAKEDGTTSHEDGVSSTAEWGTVGYRRCDFGIATCTGGFHQDTWAMLQIILELMRRQQNSKMRADTKTKRRKREPLLRMGAAFQLKGGSWTDFVLTAHTPADCASVEFHTLYCTPMRTAWTTPTHTPLIKWLTLFEEVHASHADHVAGLRVLWTHLVALEPACFRPFVASRQKPRCIVMSSDSDSSSASRSRSI